MSKGFYWRADGDGPTRIVDAKHIAEEIYESICMACNYDEFEQQKIDQLTAIANAVKQLQRDTAANNACLVATQKAINHILGGADPGDCADSSIPRDCQAVASGIDALIEVLDWEVYAVDMLGSVLNFTGVTALVDWLIAQKWYVSALTAAGIIDPLPDEIITIPTDIVTWTTVAVDALVTAGAALNKNIVDAIKADRNGIIDMLCGSTDTDIDSNLDDVINTIKNTFTDIAQKAIVQDVLQKFLKSPVSKGVILK
jgi:predicted transcriptional regulator